jgi:hypothetical protein
VYFDVAYTSVRGACSGCEVNWLREPGEMGVVAVSYCS